MRKPYCKICGFFVIMLLFIVSLTACQNNDTASDDVSDSTPVSVSKSSVNFNYPDQTAFTFTADIQKNTIQAGSPFIIQCSLKNTTDCDFFIEHGSQTITYSYNGDSENLNAISVLDTFAAGDTIDRELLIYAKKTGTITLTASFYIKPSQYAERATFQEYTYTKTIFVTVV